jgi:hypothetical protein
LRLKAVGVRGPKAAPFAVRSSPMLLTFQTLLREAGVELRDVRLLRHTKKSGRSGMSPFHAWYQDRDRFEAYQSTQPLRERPFYDVPYWASFVGAPNKSTLFVGLYGIEGYEAGAKSFTCPLSGVTVPGGSYDRYRATSLLEFERFEGRLFVDWGPGTRRWSQHADRNPKPVIEIRQHDREPPYPGHSGLVRQLSEIEGLPLSWRAILANARGVYLLTCPRTREQYVGGAYSGGGFLARWEQHARMEGDARAFRSRDPEDYRVSILEVAGSLTTDDDVHAMEQRWKEKLQSREMGLNRN